MHMDRFRNMAYEYLNNGVTLFAQLEMGALIYIYNI